MKRIYLDNQASTPLDARVAAAMANAGYGNPHAGSHAVGWEAATKIDMARQQIASLIDADADEIFFTSGATESNNLAIQGLRQMAQQGRHRLLVSAIEHKSVIAACEYMVEAHGFKLTVLPVSRDGMLDIDRLTAELDAHTALCSIGCVNNEIGTIQDIREIGRICRDAGVLLHSDAAQSPEAMDMAGLADVCDFMSLSAHKMHGPMGVGALYISRNCQPNVMPLFFGGGQQENIRPGTLPLNLCVGMGEAARLCTEEADTRTEVSRLRDLLLTELKKHGTHFTLNGPISHARHPGNANICLEDVDSEQLIGILQPWIAASTGSACNSGTIEPSYVLAAIGLSREQAGMSIRFSVARNNSEDQIKESARMIANAVTSCV